MADVTIEGTTIASFGSRHKRIGPHWTTPLIGYVFYIDSASDVKYRKTTDGGASWSSPVAVFTGTCGKLSSWADWDTDGTGTKIHLAWIDDLSDDVKYINLETTTDTLGSVIIVYNGVGLIGQNDWTASDLDICVNRDGDIGVAFWGDTVGEQGFYVSEDGGASFTAKTSMADGNAVDGILLTPGNEASTAAFWCFYWDYSANEISVKVSDATWSTWTESTVKQTSMAERTTNAHAQNWTVGYRHSDNASILAAWNIYDAATADMKVWEVTARETWTAKTDVLTDSAESAFCSLTINQQNDDLYVAYARGTALGLTVDIYYKKSSDGGGTWGSEQSYSEGTNDDFKFISSARSIVNTGGMIIWAFQNDDLFDLLTNTVNGVSIPAAGAVVFRQKPKASTFRLKPVASAFRQKPVGA